MALTTKSASGWVETFTVPGEPCTTSIAWPSPTFFSLSCRCSAASAEAIETTWDASAAPARTRVRRFLRGQADHREAIRKASTIFSVLLPMEPVEPRMAMRFMDGKDLWYRRPRDYTAPKVPAQSCKIKDQSDRQGEQQRVNAVQHAAMPRQQRSGILHSRPAFQRRLHQIAELRRDIHADRKQCDQPQRSGDDEAAMRIAL